MIAITTRSSINVKRHNGDFPFTGRFVLFITITSIEKSTMRSERHPRPSENESKLNVIGGYARGGARGEGSSQSAVLIFSETAEQRTAVR